jgi:hypothetical protein
MGSARSATQPMKCRQAVRVPASCLAARQLAGIHPTSTWGHRSTWGHQRRAPGGCRSTQSECLNSSASTHRALAAGLALKQGAATLRHPPMLCACFTWVAVPCQVGRRGRCMKCRWHPSLSVGIAVRFWQCCKLSTLLNANSCLVRCCSEDTQHAPFWLSHRDAGWCMGRGHCFNKPPSVAIGMHTVVECLQHNIYLLGWIALPHARLSRLCS